MLATLPLKARVIAVVDGAEGEHAADVPGQLARAFDEIGRSTTVVRADGELAMSKAAVLDTKKAGSLVLLVVPAEVERSAVLVVGRLADAAVFLVEPGATRVSTLAGFKREFDAARLPVLGSVTVPHGPAPVAASQPLLAQAPIVAEEL
jgi:hypothetical protein